MSIFTTLTWPKFTKLAEKTFPSLSELHPDAYGAIVSLVFNRGTSLKGNSRKEMVNIKNLIPKRKCDCGGAGIVLGNVVNESFETGSDEKPQD